MTPGEIVLPKRGPFNSRLILLQWKSSSSSSHEAWIRDALHFNKLEKIKYTLRGSTAKFLNTWKLFFNHLEILPYRVAISQWNWLPQFFSILLCVVSFTFTFIHYFPLLLIRLSIFSLFIYQRYPWVTAHNCEYPILSYGAIILCSWKSLGLFYMHSHNATLTYTFSYSMWLNCNFNSLINKKTNKNMSIIHLIKDIWIAAAYPPTIPLLFLTLLQHYSLGFFLNKQWDNLLRTRCNVNP